MPSGILLGLGLIPSMILVFVILTTFYGSTRAYLAISWFPLALVLSIFVIRQLLAFQNLSEEWWLDLTRTIGWASLVQFGLGIALLVRSIYEKEQNVFLLAASSLSLLPFLLRFL
jgi:hypothetical protein